MESTTENKSTPPEKLLPLTVQRKKFCEEYRRNGWNGTKAAIFAGYAVPSARITASYLLTLPNIQQYIKELETKLEITTGISKDRILTAWAEIAFNSMENYFGSWIKKIEFESLTPHQKACISEIETRVREVQVKNPGTDKEKRIKVEEVRFKIYSRTDALEQVAKLMGYYAAEKHENKNINLNANLVSRPMTQDELKAFNNLLESDV